MPSDQMPVCWFEGVLNLEKRSRYGIATLINEMFDNTREYEFLHCSGMADLPSGTKEAIVVVHGEHLLHRAYEVLRDLNTLDRSLVILFCDETPVFPGATLVGGKRKIWLQTPTPTGYPFADRYLICGYPHDAKVHLSGSDVRSVDRPLDWFFAGQVTHGRRSQCVRQLREMKGGLLLETPGFWQGMDRSSYYVNMASAKIIPCPSGPATPDTMRMAEALEAGCVPIVDGNCSRNGYPSGYWDFVLKSKPPFRIVEDWDTLPQIMVEELEKWPANRDALLPWWVEYKRSMSDWLREDIETLRRA